MTGNLQIRCITCVAFPSNTHLPQYLNQVPKEDSYPGAHSRLEIDVAMVK